MMVNCTIRLNCVNITVILFMKSYKFTHVFQEIRDVLFNADGSSFNEKDGIDGLRQLDPTKGKTDRLTDPKLKLY